MSRSPDLANAPIPELVRSLAVPASVGFFFNTLFNITDTWFAGLLSTQALAALSLSFPVFFSVLAVGNGLATGTTALVAGLYGAGRQDEARALAAQSLSFGLLAAVAITVLGLASSRWVFGLLGATGSYLDDAVAYMDVIFLGAVTIILISLCNGLLSAVGRTKPMRNALMAGAAANAVLDPWFLFGGLGLPPLGLPGIAWATVLCQLGSLVYLWRQARQAGIIGPDVLRQARPRLSAYRDIARQGVPAAVNVATVGLGIFVITAFIARFGQAPVAGYIVATRIEQLALLPSIGLNTACLALVAHNYGAGRMDRVRATVATCLRAGAWIMVPAGLIIFALAGPLVGLFTDDPAVVDAAVGYLRIAAFVLYAYVVLYTGVAAMQGLKRPMFAVWLGVGRQIAAPWLALSLAVEVLGLGLPGIWWSIALVVWGAAILAWAIARRTLARLDHAPQAVSPAP